MWSVFMNVPCDLKKMCNLLLLGGLVYICQLIDGVVEYNYTILTDYLLAGSVHFS